MPLFELKSDAIERLKATSFSDHGIKERADLQRLLRTNLDVVVPDTLVLTEEFGEWSESKRRIDLLALDKHANIVVIELKRSEDGGHMELQAIRYAAMVSNMTFEQAVEARREFQTAHGIVEDARAKILEFLGWAEPTEELFAQEVRIVLISADFSEELTTSVMWLNSFDLDIRCVRLRPYTMDGRVVLDVQQIIPLPEVADYQVQVQQKAKKEKQAREYNVDFTRFDVSINGAISKALWKRQAILKVTKTLVDAGVAPAQINDVLNRPPQQLWRSVDGELDSAAFQDLAGAAVDGYAFSSLRWFCNDDELMHVGGRTYAFSNQWGGESWRDAMDRYVKGFPKFEIKFGPTNGEQD